MVAVSRTERRWTKVEAHLTTHFEILLRRGFITAKTVASRRVWVLRFRARKDGRKCHRSIYLGGDEIRGKAQAWLRQLRRIREWQQEIDVCTRMVVWISRKLDSRRFNRSSIRGNIERNPKC